LGEGRCLGAEGVVGGGEVGEGGESPVEVGEGGGLVSGGVMFLLWRRNSEAGQVDQYEALGPRS